MSERLNISAPTRVAMVAEGRAFLAVILAGVTLASHITDWAVLRSTSEEWSNACTTAQNCRQLLDQSCRVEATDCRTDAKAHIHMAASPIEGYQMRTRTGNTHGSIRMVLRFDLFLHPCCMRFSIHLRTASSHLQFSFHDYLSRLSPFSLPARYHLICHIQGHAMSPPVFRAKPRLTCFLF